jgi:hypothetical protein
LLSYELKKEIEKRKGEKKEKGERGMLLSF